MRRDALFMCEGKVLAGLNLQLRSAGGDVKAVQDRIQAWLVTRPEFAGRALALSNLQYIDGSGSANETLTAELRYAEDGGGQAVREVVVRMISLEMRPYLESRLERQLAIIEWVRAHTRVPVAHVLAADTTGEAMGRPFLLMGRIRGRSAPDFPGYNVKGFIFEMSPEERRAL